MTQNSAKNKLTILAISGSLRENSSNSSIINAAAGFADDNINFTIYKGLGSLPHFDDSKEPAPEVLEWRQLLRNADGILICQPEYAFGVAGVLKNALDWTVTTADLAYKPLALITAATGGDKAHAALLLTLNVLMAKLTDDTTLLIQYVRSKLDEHGGVKDPDTKMAIKSVMNSLVGLMNEAAAVNE
ncbi:MAG: NAD(P)H-dependent oxidoreductase [Flavipsychrobacter sp.]|nr:NAD(P)H-dependent oxidoreductase [Flavipsychrobacter sp.]